MIYTTEQMMCKVRTAAVLLICATTVFCTDAQLVQKPSYSPSGSWKLLDENLKNSTQMNISYARTKPLLVQSDCGGQTKLVQSILSPMILVPKETTSPNVTNQQNQDKVKVAQRITNFLSRRLASVIGGTDNMFFSPFSISVALAMTYLGAGGVTATEMGQALGYNRILGNESLQTIHDSFHQALTQMEVSSDVHKMLVANGMFIQTGYSISPIFINALKNQYAATVMFSDFANKSNAAVKEINDWTSNHTQGKILKLLDEPPESSTVLALLNAIYFKGSWKYPFSSKNSRTFHNADGTTTVTPFLINKKRVQYFDDDKLGYCFLSLAYKDSPTAMLLVLPKNRDQFPTIDVTTKLMNHVRKNFEYTTVVVMIPKFKLSYSRELSKDMKKLGMVDLFSEQSANLTGMRRENDLFLSIMVHKAVVDVNEEGTEAAAATGMTFASRSGYSAFKVWPPSGKMVKFHVSGKLEDKKTDTS